MVGKESYVIIVSTQKSRKLRSEEEELISVPLARRCDFIAYLFANLCPNKYFN